MILYSESISLAFGEPPDFGVKKSAIAGCANTSEHSRTATTSAGEGIGRSARRAALVVSRAARGASPRPPAAPGRRGREVAAWTSDRKARGILIARPVRRRHTPWPCAARRRPSRAAQSAHKRAHILAPLATFDGAQSRGVGPGRRWGGGAAGAPP